ncbi:MAG TPA: roadblock/LC7 domain-containing protein [Micromonosporaceae bacterium]|nr:roadblock/LC7 domain-containing protein [Micromonosporaceae bacterium]
MSVEQEVLVEIRRLRDQVPGVLGSLVASFDGMLVADDTPSGVEPTGLAALAAAGLGLGQRIAATVHHGDLTETVVSATSGHVATYAAGNRVLFTVVASAATNVGLLHIEARQVAERVAAIVEVLDVEDGDDLFAPGADDRMPGASYRPSGANNRAPSAGYGAPVRAGADLPRRDLPRRGDPVPPLPRRGWPAAG